MTELSEEGLDKCVAGTQVKWVGRMPTDDSPDDPPRKQNPWVKDAKNMRVTGNAHRTMHWTALVIPLNLILGYLAVTQWTPELTDTRLSQAQLPILHPQLPTGHHLHFQIWGGLRMAALLPAYWRPFFPPTM